MCIFLFWDEEQYLPFSGSITLIDYHRNENDESEFHIDTITTTNNICAKHGDVQFNHDFKNSTTHILLSIISNARAVQIIIIVLGK